MDTLKLWIEKIGIKNHKHMIKYLLLKKYGYCSPHNDFISRMKLWNSIQKPITQRNLCEIEDSILKCLASKSMYITELGNNINISRKFWYRINS